jgi:hypothetical protein
MTYNDWEITYFEVMSWVSRQAEISIHKRDSSVGSLSEFTEFWQSFHTRLNQSSKNSVEPEWIPAELLHLTYSEDSQQARKSTGPRNLASLYSRKIEFGAPWYL